MSSSSATYRFRAAARPEAQPADAAARGLWPWPVWVIVFAGVIAAAAAIVFATGMTPSFDAYGWLTWGHQILDGHLNLNAAPSWKPLTFIFTLPESLFGRHSPRLWSITAVAGTLSMSVFAGRIAYRLARGPVPAPGARRIVSAWIGALFAAAGAIGVSGLSHLVFIANSDPLNSALVLAAVDAHLSRRPRLAYVALFLAALGRPEVWPFLGLYGLWLIWKVPGARVLVLAGWALTLLGWYVPTGIWSHSLGSAGDLDLGKATACTGDKFACVGSRWVSMYEWPMQLAAILAVAFAVLRRDRAVLGLTVASLLWLLVEVAFSYHGFSAVQRYILEPAEVMIAVAGVGMAQLLDGLSGVVRRRPASVLLSVVGPLVAIGIFVGAARFAHLREFRIRAQLPAVRNFGIVVHHMSAAIRVAGGRAAILRCVGPRPGTVATQLQYQSQLAWAMGINVAFVDFNPPLLIKAHRRMVLFTETGTNSWQVRPYNVPAALARHCTGTVASVPYPH